MDSTFKKSRGLLACASLLALAACGDPNPTTLQSDGADNSAETIGAAGATPTSEVLDDPRPGVDGTVLVDGQTDPLANPPGLAAAQAQAQAAQQGEQYALATLQPVNDSQVTGSITFTQQSGGVAIMAQLNGLEPGMHGFHIHEFGDCSAPDGSSAGEHWNPENREHGAPTGNPGERHLGDLGNVEVTESGEVRYDHVDSVISLTGNNGIVGKAIVVHAMEDDLMSQPSGNSGDPVACGVIEGGSQLTQDPQGGPDNV